VYCPAEVDDENVDLREDRFSSIEGNVNQSHRTWICYATARLAVQSDLGYRRRLSGNQILIRTRAAPGDAAPGGEYGLAQRVALHGDG
jgi:hypothetical protein